MKTNLHSPVLCVGQGLAEVTTWQGQVQRQVRGLGLLSPGVKLSYL